MNHRNKEDLRELYIEQQLNMEECAELLGCSNWTVHKWLHHFDIPTRPDGSHRVPWATYGTDKDGYEKWVSGCKTVGVSQLTAIANGADPEKVFSDGDYHVHHRNKCTFDNRPENLELVHHKEHSEIHKQNQWVYDKRLGCNVLDSKQRYGRTNRNTIRARYANPDWYYAI